MMAFIEVEVDDDDDDDDDECLSDTWNELGFVTFGSLYISNAWTT
jgi:hypothetical protein